MLTIVFLPSKGQLDYPQNVSGALSSLRRLKSQQDMPAHQKRPLSQVYSSGSQVPFLICFEHHKRPIIPLPFKLYPLIAVLALVKHMHISTKCILNNTLKNVKQMYSMFQKYLAWLPIYMEHGSNNQMNYMTTHPNLEDALPLLYQLFEQFSYILHCNNLKFPVTLTV